jgi:DNA invertase Pin-like site-specific DNA recombinase
MKGYRVYSQIQQLKEKGFKKANVAKQLGINRRTVDRYWNMSADEYEARITSIRRF